jgi:hypothetical protein
VRHWKLLSLVLFLLPWVPAAGDSVEPDLRRLIREAEKPKVHYGPARVGWNGPEKPLAAQATNPVYESLRLDSPAAIRRELKAVLIPDWQMLLAFTALILGLRMLRSSQSAARTESAPNVVPFPAQPLPREKAA